MNVVSRIKMNRLAALIAAACAVAMALSFGFGAQQAWAGGTPGLDTLEKGGKFTVSYKGKARDMGYRDFYAPEGVKVANAKSGNPKVASAKVESVPGTDGAMSYLRVNLKKAGTTKLSFDLDGRQCSVDFQVKKYVNPFASLKIGSKEYASYCNPKKLSDHCYYASSTKVPTKALSGKVKVKAKKGWKVDEIYSYGKSGAYKTIKNGSTVKSNRQIGISVTNTKTNMWEVLYLNTPDAI